VAKTALASGGTTLVSVTTGSSCAWTASSNAAWLTFASGATGTGNGTVSVTVASNGSGAQRTGTVTIAGNTFTVTQPAILCNYSVTPGLVTIGATGSTGTVSVTTTLGCTWTTSGAPSWITISSATNTGSGTIGYTVAPNTGAARSAIVLIAGKSVTFSQAEATAPVAPGNLRLVGPAGPSR
jgi:hypothetical protein